MRVFNVYDLKDGKDSMWICDEPAQEEVEAIEKEEEREEPFLITALKAIFPTVVSLFVYWLLSQYLYNARGVFAIGSEILVPFIMWYVIYRIVDYVF